jgi:ATP-binding protein involved in chromosome partitioning
LHGLVDPSMIGSVQIDEGQAIVTLEVDPAKGGDFETLRQSVEHKVASLKGVKKALVILTAERKPPVLKQKQHKAARLEVSGVKKIIAVASGKGGVGKSTVAANLAVALSQMGQKVGLLDADIYGPSVPRLMGISGQKPEHGDDSRIIPLTAHGLKIMSMGFLVEEDTPMIWRGPMVQSAIQQLLRDVAWAELDILVIDMPPGTGDAQLTLAQKVPLAGAVIVSTPQDIALIDARKGLEMFRKVAVPVLGIVENMSYYCCPECGHRADIFGHGGAREQAEKVGCPFLGEVPLHAEIRRLSDEGLPITISDPSGHQAKAFQEIARNALAGLETASRPAPEIFIEE